MNKTIKALNKKLAATQGDASAIEAKLQTAYNEVFDKNEEIQKAIREVQTSQEYAWDNYGEICQYIRFYANDFKDCQEYLKNYLRENHYIEIDFQADILTYSQGFNIVINEDGDVYDQDSDKFFIKKNDYRNDDGELDTDKRNELIEAYMEERGYFPGVFSSDRYGNVFAVNTQAKKKTA